MPSKITVRFEGQSIGNRANRIVLFRGDFRFQRLVWRSLRCCHFSSHSNRRFIPKITASSSRSSSSVKFRVPVHVQFGETVKVVGNHPLLGSWNTEDGLELEWSDGHIWEKQLSITPGNYEFKCVIIPEHGFPQWEPGPNRVLRINDGEKWLDVGCKWWNTSMNNIKTLIPPLTRLQQPTLTKTPVLELKAAGHCIPHVKKLGEDAYFICSSRNGVIGLADGVGSWSKKGVDPALYAKAIMQEAKRAVESTKRKFNSKEVMMVAQNKATVLGSSTCILAILEQNLLDICNLGDSGLRLLRNGRIIFKTEPQDHSFNRPFQLSCLDYSNGDRALDAINYEFPVEEGDLIIMGSDGIFDNVWDEGLEELVKVTLRGLDHRSELTALTLAKGISSMAHRNAQNPEFYSPWTDETTRAVGQGPLADQLVQENAPNTFMGGKMDDCTAIVAFVTSA